MTFTLFLTAWVLTCALLIAWMICDETDDDEPRAALPPENPDDLLREIACTTDHAKLTHLAARAARLPAPAQHHCLDLIQHQLNQR